MPLDHFERAAFLTMGVLVILLGALIIRGDQVGVPIQAYSPQDEGSPAAETTISITFGDDMDRPSVEERFHISPEVEGEFSWQGNTVTFTPRTALEPGVTYEVMVEAGARSTADSQTLDDFELRFTPRELSIYFLGPSDVQIQSLWRVPLSGGEPDAIYTTDFGITDFDISPDGEQIALTLADENGSGDVWLISGDGERPRRLTECAPGICSNPDWRPNGEQIAYERRDENLQGGGIGPSRVWFYDLTTDETQAVYEDSQILGFSPTWSPDGAKLAFFDSNSGEIRVLDVVEGATYRVPSEMGEVGTFSADGERMIFTDIRLVGMQFFTELREVGLFEGGDLGPLFDESEEDQWPALSPTGDQLAFGRRLLDRSEGFGSQMMLYDINSGELTQITADPAVNSLLFQWDPTGRYVLFTRFNLEERYAQPQLWVYDTETGDLRVVASAASIAEWRP